MPPRYHRYARAKRILDVTLVVSAMPLLVPVFAACVVAIRLDSPGRVMYSQLRTGHYGRLFRMWKFRTMVHNAEELKEQLQHLNVLPPPDFKIPDDPRVTRVGKILRKTSLDELPQLINVLRGEMSLVGPRPTDFGVDQYDLWHTSRLEVPPGITGRWQVTGRGSTDFDARLRLDNEYIRRISLWEDVKLLFRTVGAVVKGTGT
jgi:lipopolysaccharide/colanic/teichoic acid biosynthesis glycosyltransferase